MYLRRTILTGLVLAVGMAVLPHAVVAQSVLYVLTGVALMGGYAGCEAPDPDEYDVEVYESALSGDLNSDDDPAPASNCCYGHHAPACDDSLCEDTICSIWPSCCADQWDDACALHAASYCCESCGNTCDNAYHVLTGNETDETAILDGFLITAGNANGSANDLGGGLFVSFGAPMIVNCSFVRNNASVLGGAIYNANAHSTLIGCTFAENKAGQAGGIFNAGGSPQLAKCLFTENVAIWGGAVQNHNSSPRLRSCRFIENYAAGGHGGGLYNGDHSSPT